nr:hypothetical protein Iba_chr09aCG9590 [Ipomoea batatas]GMD33976.1 hypothetical protein Iba_chr09cCG7700 [Ipomoea batatas]GMD35675.1 hypothetical protein Iba_chr09dCG9160 [Ipomoea batatas]
MYFGKQHLGKTVEGPTSSGPGMKRNRLCSFSRWWDAISSPSFPNCDLRLEKDLKDRLQG